MPTETKMRTKFPLRMFELLEQMAQTQAGADGQGPWQYADGSPMQQDALAALDWIATARLGVPDGATAVGAHLNHPSTVGRIDDMPSGVKALVVNCNGEGELSVRIIELDRGRSAMVTFCDDDKGRSPETCAALAALMEAITRDNAQLPSLAHYSPAA